MALIRFRSWIATDDHAIFQLTLERMGDGHMPLTGAYSRLGVRHPGPAREWLFGAAYWFTGRRAAVLPATALAVNLGLGVLGLAAARRSGGPRHLLGAAAGLLLLVTGLMLDLHSPWNPHLACLAGWAAFWTTVAAMRRGGWARPAAVVCASFAAQLHAAFVPLAAIALGAVLVTWWRSVPLAVRWQPAALAIACWIGPLLDLRHGRNSNLVRIVFDSDGERIGVVRAVQYVAHQMLPWSVAQGDFRTPGGGPPPAVSPWAAVALVIVVAAALAAVTVGGIGRHRAGGADRLLAGAGFVALLGAVVSAAVYVDPIYPYLFAPLGVALVAPVGVGAALVATPLARPLVVAAGVVTCVATIVTALPALAEVESIVDSPIERGLHGAMHSRVEPGADYDIVGYGMHVGTFAQVALYVEQFGGYPYSEEQSLGLGTAPAGADVFVTAMNEPLACLEANTPSTARVARDLNQFTGMPVGVFELSAAEARHARDACALPR